MTLSLGCRRYHLWNEELEFADGWPNFGTCKIVDDHIAFFTFWCDPHRRLFWTTNTLGRCSTLTYYLLKLKAVSFLQDWVSLSCFFTSRSSVSLLIWWSCSWLDITFKSLTLQLYDIVLGMKINLSQQHLMVLLQLMQKITTSSIHLTVKPMNHGYICLSGCVALEQANES